MRAGDLIDCYQPEIIKARLALDSASKPLPQLSLKVAALKPPFENLDSQKA